MKILYLHQYFVTPDSQGGTRSYEMARRLVKLGHEVHMITTDRAGTQSSTGWRESLESGIRVHWTPVPYDNKMSHAGRMKSFSTFMLRASRRCLEVGGDVVFATSTPLTIAVPAIVGARCLRAPMVFEVRDLWPSVPIAMGVLKNPAAIHLAIWLERLAYGHSTRIVALTPGMKEHIVGLGYPASKTAVIPNGADLELFDVPASEGERIRKSHSWLGDRPLVVYIGALGLVNGVDYLVHLACEVARCAPNVRFAVVGSGREETAIADLARVRGVLDRNFFMVGPISKRDVPAWLSASTVATSLIVDRRENWINAVTNKFFDALAAGRPIVSNHGGWQSEIAEAENFGAVLSREPALAARALLALLDNPEWLSRASERARAVGRSRFDRDLLAKDLEQVLVAAHNERKAVAR